MALRTLSLIFMAAVMVGAAPVQAAKEKKKPAKQASRTWKFIADYVLKNGGDDSIKAPSTRTMGFDSDEIAVKSLGLDETKSKDGRDHSIFVVFEKNDSGAQIPKEIVVSSTLVKEVDSQKGVEGCQIRLSLDGAPIRGMQASGILGHVVQKSLAADSKELLAELKKERSLYLNELDLTKLTQ